MSLEADRFLDRMVLKGKLLRWRLISFVAVVVALLGWGFYLSRSYYSFYGDGHPVVSKGDFVARVTIDGVITGDYARDDMMRRIKENSSIKAVIVRINSPGGVAGASEMLYRQLREVASQKPVVAVMDSVAASGGYMTAIGADYIVANETTLTGSIGVVFQFFDAEALMKKVGVSAVEIKSSEYKAAPSPFVTATEGVKAAWEDVNQDIYRFFSLLVAQRRGIQEDVIENIANGKVYTGAQALYFGLVDALGGEEIALDYLSQERMVKNLMIRDVKPKKEGRLNALLKAQSQIVISSLRSGVFSRFASAYLM